jgi:hypothetical protein
MEEHPKVTGLLYLHRPESTVFACYTAEKLGLQHLREAFSGNRRIQDGR